MLNFSLFVVMPHLCTFLTHMNWKIFKTQYAQAKRPCIDRFGEGSSKSKINNANAQVTTEVVNEIMIKTIQETMVDVHKELALKKSELLKIEKIKVKRRGPVLDVARKKIKQYNSERSCKVDKYFEFLNL